MKTTIGLCLVFLLPLGCEKNGATQVDTLADEPVVEADPPEEDRRSLQEFELKVGEPHLTKNGIGVSINRSIQDFVAGGGTSTSYSIDLERGAEKIHLNYDHMDDDPNWYAEGLAFGYLFTISRGEDLERRTVTLTPSEEKPLSRAQEAARGETLTRGALCGAGQQIGREFHTGPGTYGVSRYNEGARECTLVVGVYTQKVVFSRDWREKARKKK